MASREPWPMHLAWALAHMQVFLFVYSLLQVEWCTIEMLLKVRETCEGLYADALY